MRFAGTSFRTFVLYPVLVVAFADLALNLRSWVGAALALSTAAWLQFRVRRDERRLAERFGEPYMQYCSRVKRRSPAVF